MLTYHILVSGKVQGVYFRQSTKSKAEALGITGTVENLQDGNTVSILASGDKDQLDRFIEWCRQGPPMAIVEQVQTEELAPQVFERFSIKPA